MLSNRSRFLDALRGGAPKPPPAAPLYLSLYLEPRRRRLLAGVYGEMAEGDSHLRLTFEEEIEAQLESLDRALSIFAEPPAWLPLGLGATRDSVHGAKVTFPTGQCLWHGPCGRDSVDYLGPFDSCHRDVWELERLPTAQQIATEPPPASAETYESLGCLEYTRQAVHRFGERTVPCGHLGSPFWHCYARLGFVGMMQALHEDPALIEAVCARDLQTLLSIGEALWNAGVRCVFVEECLSSSDLISVQDYQRFAFPATQSLLAGLKALGFSVVYYFCGGIEGRLPSLAQLPADALAFEESKKGFIIDLARIRAEIGPDKLLFGNLDVTLLRDGTEAQIAAEVARQYATAGQRFVASTGSPVTLDTPPEKVDMLVRAVAL